MKVLWVASYPRSGNTWVRFLLHAYLHGPIGASIEVARTVPNIHRPIEINPALQSARPGERLMIKTHGLPDQRHPLLDKTEAFIYVVRHPRDVLLSAINIHNRSGANLDANTYARTFIRLGGDPLWLRFGFGEWGAHADAWTSAGARWPHVIVRYEDLIRDPRVPLGAMVRLLGETPTPERLDEAVRHASFESMRAMEEADRGRPLAEGIFLKPAESGDGPKNFVNKGRTGQSLAHIAPDLDALFEARFGEAMARHGYAGAPSRETT